MAVIKLDQLTLRRAQIADILLEGLRRAESPTYVAVAEYGGAPPVQQQGEADAAFALRLADFFINLAIAQSISAADCFDRDVFVLARQERAAAAASAEEA